MPTRLDTLVATVDQLQAETNRHEQLLGLLGIGCLALTIAVVVIAFGRVRA